MLTARQRSRRTGSVVPLVAFSMVALLGFLALAIDIGMLTISKVQAQDAADLACLAAARTLSGDSTTSPPYNQGTATTNAQNILTYNSILGQQITPSSQLTLTYGSYDYNQATQTFNANFPATSGVPVTAVKSQYTTPSSPSAFANVWGIGNLSTVTAYATAVHRPRDVALVMDLSNSMRFGTNSRYDFMTTDGWAQFWGYNGNYSMNPDTNVPTFAQYSGGNAATYLIGSSSNSTSQDSNYTLSPTNITAATSSYTQTYVNSFYSNAAYATTWVRAFDSYTSSDQGTTWAAPSGSTSPQLPSTGTYTSTPGGDIPLYKSGSTTTYATSVNDILGSSSTNIMWELDGYSSAYSGGSHTKNINLGGSTQVPDVWSQSDYGSQPFYGYTQGPGYYGKTFFLWPPDPRNASTSNGGSTPAVGSITTWLNNLGMTNANDQSTVSTNWGTWTLAQLQSWMTGASTKGGPYKNTGPYVPGTNSKAAIYYAVCRLYNRAYPAGSSNPAFVADWRQRFFGTTNNNTLFYSATGSLNVDNLTSGSLSINYGAILRWLQSVDTSGNAQSWTTTPPNPFPSTMRAGRIKYYGAIPTSISGSWPNYGGTTGSYDARFWKESIDYMLGLFQDTSSHYTDLAGVWNSNQDSSNGIGNFYTGSAGYHEDFTWGTMAVNSTPSAPQYMNYNDNPARGVTRFWMGPLMMVDYLANCNMYEQGGINNTNYNLMDPGDGYIAPSYSCKQGFQGAIDTMKTNHPNDWFTLVFYNSPRLSSGSVSGAHNCVGAPMGANYDYASASLYFPFSTIKNDGTCNNTEVTPYDADAANSNVPSANFTNISRPYGSTSFAMGLMLAYNQFVTTPSSDNTLRTFVTSSPIQFPTGMAGGLGRKGAQKVVVFETDGMANYPVGDSGSGNNYATAPSGTLSGAGYTPLKYYKVRYDMNKPGSSEFPYNTTGQVSNNSGSVVSQITGIIKQMGGAAQTGGGGDFGSTRNPFRLYAIGFGPVFVGPDKASATATLTSMQTAAGVTSTPTTVTGSDSTMTKNMTTAFTDILQNGIQIALIQ